MIEFLIPALALSLVMTLFALGIARMFFGNDPEE